MEHLDHMEGGKLVENGAVKYNGTIHVENVKVGPPDGGVRAWSVMVGSFLINGCLFGVINSFGTIMGSLEDELKGGGFKSPKEWASAVGSLAFGVTFLLSPVSGMLTSSLGIRTTAFLGGFIAAAGILFSAFFLNNVYVLYLTYSIMYGCGASLAYTPSLAILGHYFDRYLGIVNGVVSAGSSVFTAFMPQLLDTIVTSCGLFWAFIFISAITFCVALCSLLFQPTSTMLSAPKSSKSGLNSFDIWKNNKYRIWALAVPSALFGYFVPYVMLPNYIKATFPDANKNFAVQSIALTSLAGRLLFGFLADRPKANRILLQQISFYVIGSLTMLLPLVNSYALLIVVCLGMGIFDGAFISLLGPIAFELVGEARAAQGIGSLLGLASVPVTVGPPIASAILEATGSYTLPLILAGLPPIIGATVMFLTYYVKVKPQTVMEHSNGKNKDLHDHEESQPMAEVNTVNS